MMSVWSSLVGQEAAVAKLSEAAASARAIVASRGGSRASDDARSMSHAWLITGPPGSGRSVAARAFAAALQCTGETVGCGQCAGCRTTMGRTNADVVFAATETSIINVETARSLVLQAQSSPSQGLWRVIVVEDADRLGESGANALLKAIEEPPEHTVWLLCAPSPEDMIATIRSRCRHLGLRIPTASAVADLLVREGIATPEVALEAARAAQSHIGLARALARDPQMRERRRAIITAPASVRSVGEAVMAIGNPLGYDDTATTGIVSALNRPVTVTDDDNNAIVTNAVQIDAAINPGNSGGPTFNAAGQVIGINSSIASTASSSGTAGSIGIGFAIPSNLVKRVTNEIIDNGSVKHVVLGITIKSSSVEADGVTRGCAQVQAVTDGGPASKAGVKAGDSIVAFNGKAVNNNYSLLGYVRASAMGDKVKLTVVRGGNTMDLEVTLDQEETKTNSSNKQEQRQQNNGNDDNGNGQNGGSQNGQNGGNGNNGDGGGLFDPFGLW